VHTLEIALHDWRSRLAAHMHAHSLVALRAPLGDTAALPSSVRSLTLWTTMHDGIEKMSAFLNTMSQCAHVPAEVHICVSGRHRPFLWTNSAMSMVHAVFIDALLACAPALNARHVQLRDDHGIAAEGPKLWK
jgi:hypothetical protein